MMKQIILTILVVFTMTGCIGAGVNSSVVDRGDHFLPSMEGIDLHGKARQIPEIFDKEYNIVLLAFEREQQTDVNTWIERTEQLVTERDDINFYELPIIYEMNAPSRTWVNNGMRAGIEEDRARKRTITIYTDREKFFSMMNMSADRIYALITNKAGKIIWREEGLASDKKMLSLRRVVEK